MEKRVSDVFENRELIEPLVGALADKKTESAARKCLVLIEEPSLQHIEKLELTKPLTEAMDDVKKAIEKRKAKFANSNWRSAAGN